MCFHVEVDRGERLVAGKGETRLVLLPGECAEGSASQLGRAGLHVRVVSASQVDDGRAGRGRVVPLAPGHVTEVRLRSAKRRPTADVRTCTDRVPTP